MYLQPALAHFLVEAASGLSVWAWIAIGTGALLLCAGVGVILLGMRRPGPPPPPANPPRSHKDEAHAGHGRHRA